MRSPRLFPRLYAGMLVLGWLLPLEPALAQTPPSGWTCDAEYYGTNDGCDCGCGVADPDCTDTTVDGCLYDNCRASGQLANPDDPTQCRVVVCGDRVIEGFERCDDGNAADGDGCSANCAVESGWVCEEGDSCREITCGDNIVDYPEYCDDGNTISGDGCSADCSDIEDGFGCREGRGCHPIECGDGFDDYPEACDDGNTTSGDGCDATCSDVEEGYVCPNEGASCITVPPAWVNGGTDNGACNPAYFGSNDGCDCGCGVTDPDCESSDASACGFFVFCPAGSTLVEDDNSKCVPPVCGDGSREGGEDCDDGNLSGGDGCSAECVTEPSYTCLEDNTGLSSCRVTVCGDGELEGGEECDDGNDDAGDGCSDVCALEAGFSCIVPGEACVSVPASWSCDPAYFGAGDGCDCGCGADDADCGSPYTVEECWYNNCDTGVPATSDPSSCVDEGTQDDGGEPTGGDSTGGDSTGGDSTAGDSTGGDSTGSDTTFTGGDEDEEEETSGPEADADGVTCSGSPVRTTSMPGSIALLLLLGACLRRRR